MFSKSSILARPGWSPVVFEELMGAPDEVRSGLRKTQLYRLERVFAVETSVRFKEIMQPFEILEYRAPVGQLLSTNRFRAVIESMVIGVIVFTEGRVREGAIGHYNANRTENFATRGSADELIRRIMVEYARENLVFFDETIEEATAKVADTNASKAIRTNIYQAIAKTYPTLAQECFAQLGDRSQDSENGEKKTLAACRADAGEPFRELHGAVDNERTGCCCDC